MFQLSSAGADAVLLGVGAAAIAVGSAPFLLLSAALNKRKANQRERAVATESLEAALVTAHAQSFPSAKPPPAGGPPRVSNRERRGIYHAERDSRYGSTSWRHFRARARARHAAQDATTSHVRELDAALDREYSFRVRTWPGLQINDSVTVLETLEHAFVDNAAPAFAVSSEGDTAAIVVLLGSPDDIPDEMCVRDQSGEPELRKRPQENRSQLFAAAASSAILASLRQSFAAAPRIDQIDLMAIVRRNRHIRSDVIEPVCLVSASRAQVDDLDLHAPAFDSLRRLAPDIRVEAKTSTLLVIDLAGHAEAQEALTVITTELGDKDESHASSPGSGDA